MRHLISLAFLCMCLGVSVGLTSCASSMGLAPCQPNPAHDLLAEINRIRAIEGIPPVRPNPLLAQAAQAHAVNLGEREGNGHFGPEGSTPLDRISEAGYLPMAFGENIAWGTFTPQETVQAWMDSPGHRMVLLDPTYDELGLGGVLNPRRPIWVAKFGARREKATGRCHSWPVR